MVLWEQSIEILRESIFAYAQVCNGNLGAGILVVTFLARLALLPLGVRMARVTSDHQRAMARVKPKLRCASSATYQLVLSTPRSSGWRTKGWRPRNSRRELLFEGAARGAISCRPQQASAS
jgi:hypothetical protein